MPGPFARAQPPASMPLASLIAQRARRGRLARPAQLDVDVNSQEYEPKRISFFSSLCYDGLERNGRRFG
jgi:hypothetical protein